MAIGTATYEGLAVPLLGEFEIKQQTAATDFATLTQAASPTGLPLVIQNSSSSKVFHLDTKGMIRTMGLATQAIASLASNATTSFALTGATTDDAVVLMPLKVLTTGNGCIMGNVTSAGQVDYFSVGGSVAANTYGVWVFRTKSN